MNVGFAIIGCGMISRYHAAAIAAVERAELIGVYGEDQDSAERMAAQNGVKRYAPREEIWKDAQVAAASICVPSGLHAMIALEALEHGKHVLIEKPMALTLSDCDRLIEAGVKNDRLVCVVSQLRFSPDVARARQMVREGALGRLVSVGLYMKYYRSQEYYDGSPWRGTWDMDGGGALMNQGIHGVDLIQYIVGPVSRIFACAGTLSRKIETEDTLSAVMQFKNGALGVIEAATSVYPGYPRRIELCGDAGTLILEEDKIVRLERDNPAAELTKDAADMKAQEEREERIPGRIPERQKTAASHRNAADIDAKGHICQVADLVSAVLDGTPLLVDGREGRKAVELVLGAYRSASSGLPTEFPFAEG